MMFNVLAIVLCLLQQTMPIGPQNNNPYCGMSASSYPAPSGPVQCEEGFEINEACWADCKTSYSDFMLSASQEACLAWDDNYDVYLIEELGILLGAHTCVSNATTQEEIIDCGRIMNNQLTEAANTLARAQGKVDDFMDAFETSTQAAYWACAMGCCEVSANGLLPFLRVQNRLSKYTDLSVCGL
jgi:hypothetical protein